MKRFLATLLACAPAAALAGPHTVDEGRETAQAAPAPASAPAVTAAAPEPEITEEDPEVIEIVQKAPPGAATTVGAGELERFEHDDVHKVLLTVPGVYVRQEDGYGLRPNIGMRGAAAERSAKVTLMEDGVLIAPAPYSAPAAYYFPMVTRLSSVEVVKGPAAILYGPATVGGAVNVSSAPLPTERSLRVDVAGGSDLYGKLHLRAGERWNHGGLMVEGVALHAGGFKELDGGGDTGFDKQDLLVKGRVNSDPGPGYQQLELKLGWSHEISDETYTGLTDEDFARNPYRRYRGTQLDQMNASHLTVHAQHRKLLGGGKWVLTTNLYHHGFDRVWGKIDGFAGGRSIHEVLADPESGQNAVYYAVLTGEADSTSPAEALLYTRNDRRFVSRGLQTHAEGRLSGFGLAHVVEGGLRLHHDSAERHHTAEGMMMTGGELLPGGSPESTTLDARGSALALAAFALHRVTWHDLEVTYGLRGELVFTAWDDHTDDAMDVDAHYTALVPGIGAVYQLTPRLSLLGGVHRGFLPVSPGGQGEVSPESSINYEAGARWAGSWAYLEGIGFYSDYRNIKGSCTISSGCSSMMVDEEYDGGAARVLGLEAQVVIEPQLGKLSFPAALSYTFTHAEFLTSFTSENPQWGEVAAGDRFPYLPAHQLAARGGVRGPRWEVSLAARHVGALRDVPGQGEIADDERIPASTVIDAAGAVTLPGGGQLYLTVDNLLDEAGMVSRRPFGLRPGVPRLLVVGYKHQL